MIAIDLYFFMNAAYDLTLLCVVGIVARKRLCFGRVLAAQNTEQQLAQLRSTPPPTKTPPTRAQNTIASKEFSAKEPKFEESGFTIPKPQKEVKDISIPTFLKRN